LNKNTIIFIVEVLIFMSSTKTSDLLSAANKSILFTVSRPDIIMEKGKGMYLWDTEGRRYLDFIGGWAVTCLGHCPDVIKNVLENQVCELINASPTFYNKPMIDFAELLTDHTIVFFLKRT
jgi:acetylornithine/N-succinyldiaminopimelate aminotransferase